jgi:hypothetical protein
LSDAPARSSSRPAQATIAAAVVKAPEGSAMTQISKGGNIASRAAASASSASTRSRPPRKTQVRGAFAGARENIASCTRPRTSSAPTRA